MIIGTVVNASGLPHARLLANSVKRQMPSAKVLVCLVEEKPAEPVPDVDWIFTAREISAYLGLYDFDSYIFKFNSLQCGTAMKGRLLTYLLEAFPDEEHIVYLDPEMYVFKPLHEIEQMLSCYDVALTPHHLEPSDAWDSSREIGTLQDGTFHSGLVAVKNSQEGRHFAKWWMKIIAGDFSGQPSGIFSDQPFLNFVPAFFNAGVLRHPGYNLAFWNLHESGRKVYRIRDEYVLTNHTPLRCANFSNFLGLLDSCIDTYYPHDGTFKQMWNEYQQNWAWLSLQHPALPWAYDYFYSGEKIADETKLRYREAKINRSIEGNPFTLSNDSDF
ncbi:hypothetical protein G5B47_14670 [Paenibacillus sp. 7124]|uniref:Glycosyl transferase n=1 Tax=Paenibacillus apii TaxID=1850370 RepID=A0A6M1PN00_9BACL|nr:hypothetical protein [Paenibacillus apii]NGM83662.1 hypothetical protein [Paenibacillus apii]NJJ41232.1 hypothetical protein [Paenibacillus apii]